MEVISGNLSKKSDSRKKTRKLLFAQFGTFGYMTARLDGITLLGKPVLPPAQANLLFTSHLHSCPDGSNTKEALCPSEYCF
jgi:hypothetical protein